MSRIFDALQRSGTEQSGIEYPDMVSVAAEVLEAPRNRASTDLTTEDQEVLIPAAMDEFSITEAPIEKTESDAPAEFPSLEISVSPSIRLVSFTQPDSLAAEKFRFLGVRLRQLRQSRTLKRVLVTSTIPEEGKSLVSANLAGVLARRKERVLLLDGDLRRPVLAQQFGLGRLAGLGEWLQSGQQTASNIYYLGGPRFWFMPAGDPPANALELLQSGKLSALMEQVSTLFDWIIVDSPPLLPLADTTVWQRQTDGALLVVREGTTEKNPLQRGLEILKKADLLGVVLNASSNGNHHNYYQRYAAAAKELKMKA